MSYPLEFLIPPHKSRTLYDVKKKERKGKKQAGAEPGQAQCLA